MLSINSQMIIKTPAHSLVLRPQHLDGKVEDVEKGGELLASFLLLRVRAALEATHDIMVNGKKMIHQPTIPAISGNHGFHSESDASNAGALVKRKLLNNEMPPTISIDELNSLGIH